MSKDIYFDCTTGISGDMVTAALLDLGADRKALKRAVDSIAAGGFEVKISEVEKSGVKACDFDVVLDAEHENHDHDMAYLFDTGADEAYGTEEHGHHHHHDHNHDHDHHHHHDHEHDHDHEGHHDHDHHHEHGHHHEHRHLADIEKIIDQCDMTDGARALAKKTFSLLADAEAEAHGTTAGEVAFHEAGAIDSIVDIIAAAVCFDSLDAGRVYIPVLTEGRGTIRCQHGVLPVPVPAVTNIVKNNGLNLRIADYRGEYVTPTGAAFAAAVKTDDELPGRFRILKTGTGAGKRAYAVPSLLRAMFIEDTSTGKDSDRTDGADSTDGAGGQNEKEKYIVKLESNIDDSTGEEFGYVMQRLMEAGARDVNYFPVFMKKNRPAYQLNVVCMPEDVSRLERIIFEETSTIGIRRVRMERSVLERHVETINTHYGPADVKVVTAGGRRRIYPEYDTAAAIAERNGLPLRTVMRLIVRTAEESL